MVGDLEVRTMEARSARETIVTYMRIRKRRRSRTRLKNGPGSPLMMCSQIALQRRRI
jgi:hypothetical protein